MKTGTRIMILFMAMFLLCGCSDAPAVHGYELPDGLSFAERQYENGYKEYLKEHSDNREEDWQFHLKVRYYSEDWPEFRLKDIIVRTNPKLIPKKMNSIR